MVHLPGRKTAKVSIAAVLKTVPPKTRLALELSARIPPSEFRLLTRKQQLAVQIKAMEKAIALLTEPARALSKRYGMSSTKAAKTIEALPQETKCTAFRACMKWLKQLATSMQETQQLDEEIIEHLHDAIEKAVPHKMENRSAAIKAFELRFCRAAFNISSGSTVETGKIRLRALIKEFREE